MLHIKMITPQLIVHTVKSWFDELADEVSSLPWPPQLPNLNIIEHVWSVLENRVLDKYLQPASL